jgi:perosamine synthetase
MGEPIPWFKPVVGAAETEALAEVVASGYLNDGAAARRLETEIARFLGVSHAAAVTSGTAALALALMGLGIGPGYEVIVPDLTFIATANAVRLAGAEVKLVDVEPDRFTIDVSAAAAAVGPRTAAIIAVDVNGRACDYRVLEGLAARHGLVLVCDSAEGLGSRFAGQCLGSFGQAGCFSFSANKTVTSGQGGLVVTNDARLHERLRELKDQGRVAGGTGGDDDHPVIGFNFKYTNLQAAVALVQFAHLPERLEALRRRDSLYRQHLAGVPEIRLPPDGSNTSEICQWMDILSGRRTEIQEALTDIGAGTRAFWHPLHRQPPYAGRDEEFPNAVEISRRGLWLPSHLEITPDQIAAVCDAVIRAIK